MEIEDKKRNRVWKKRSEVGHGVTEEDATAIRFEPAKRRRCGSRQEMEAVFRNQS